MAKYFGLILVLALVHAGYALECYNCVSSGDKTCDDFADKSKISTIMCGKTISSQFKAACIKKVIEDKNSHHTNTTRACIVMKADANTEAECKAPSSSYTVQNCEVCYDDLCNSSGQININFMAFMGSIVMYFLVQHIH